MHDHAPRSASGRNTGRKNGTLRCACQSYRMGLRDKVKGAGQRLGVVPPHTKKRGPMADGQASVSKPLLDMA
eukprot:scaffold14000_cov135-Isochrysis_galbana.AAC.1